MGTTKGNSLAGKYGIYYIFYDDSVRIAKRHTFLIEVEPAVV